MHSKFMTQGVAKSLTRSALALYQQGLKVTEGLSRSAPENAQFARDLSVSYNQLAVIHKILGRLSDAIAHYGRELEIAKITSARFPIDPKAAHLVCSLYWQCLSIAEGEEKREWFARATIGITALKERGSLTADDQDFLAEAKARFGIES